MMTSFIPTPSGITFNRYRSPEYKEALIFELSRCITECKRAYLGTKTLATEDDPKVSKLCDTWELVLCHGLVENNVAYVLKNVQEMVNSNAPVELPNFWEFAYLHLLNNERERFSSLRHVSTDRGRTRSLIRATLNEHSLDRYIMTWRADPNLNKSYEQWAIMRDPNLTAELLPELAESLNSILFCLSIDNPGLNAVRVIRDVEKPEPIIDAPTPPSTSSGSGAKKKIRQIFMDTDEESQNESTSIDEKLSSLCLKNDDPPPESPKPTHDQVFNILEELPSEIQSIVCRSAPPSGFVSRSMSNSTTSERNVRLELFPEPPTSSSFVYPEARAESEQGEDCEDGGVSGNVGKEETSHEDSLKVNGKVPSSVPSDDEGSVHSSAVSSDVEVVEKLKNRLKDTEERCQYLEARVAELSLENHRLKGMTNSPRGGLTFFTVSVPRVHLENNKYYVYEIQVIPTYAGDEWTVRKRYRDFYELHQSFQKSNPGVKALDFPPKKKFGNMDSCFVEQRRQRLQVYLRHLLSILPEVSACNSRAELAEVFPFLR